MRMKGLLCRYRRIQLHTSTCMCFISVGENRVAYEGLAAGCLYPFVNTQLDVKTREVSVSSSHVGVEYTDRIYLERNRHKPSSHLVHVSKYLSTSVRRRVPSVANNHRQNTTGRPSSIKSPSWARLTLNRKGPGRWRRSVLVVCYAILSSPSGRLAGWVRGSGREGGGQNLSPGTNLLDWRSTEYQISRTSVCFLADKACLVGEVVLELGPASEPILHTHRKDDVLCVLSGMVCVCPSTSQGKSTRLD